MTKIMTKSMTKAAAGTTVVAGAAAVVILAARRRRGSGRARDDAVRWHVVTVNRVKSDLTGGERPEPLARLGDDIEILYRTAPGGRGTEVAVRPSESGRSHLDGHGMGAIRTALREAKQVWETGEVLSPDRRGTTKRTLLNRPLEYATTHGREMGRL